MANDYVMITTQPNFDGSAYVVTIEASEDRAVTLTPTVALRYAQAVLNAVQYAEYDSAVLRQMNNVLPDPKVAAHVILDLRDDRPPLDHEATAPLKIEPGVTSEYKPFLIVSIDDEQVGQWTLPDARAHALMILEAVGVADLDSAYYRLLIGLLHVDTEIARAMVADLGAWRDDYEL